MFKTGFAATLLLAAMPAAAATLQEQYAAAQEAFDAGRMAEARAGFAAVLPRLDGNPKMKLQAAVVRARIGAAANAMSEPEAAVALIAAALPVLPAGSGDWLAAALDMGFAQELAIDFDGAGRTYRMVIAASANDPVSRLSATIGAARVTMFSDLPAARLLADTALAEGEAGFTGKRSEQYAVLLALRGRIELLAGQPVAAKVWLTRAVSRAGGIGTMVSVTDVRVRGDMALAAFMAGDMENARKFFAYTGAGALPSQGFELGADAPLPACAPVGEVARDDMAIVEFSIGVDGRVTGVTPIYASRGGPSALVFARAVRGWSWRPEAAKALPAFWRQAVRLELRCANRGAEASSPMRDAANDAWLAATEALPPMPPAAAVALPLLRAELQRRTAQFGPASPQLLHVLLAIDANKVSPPDEVAHAVAAALAIARSVKAPDDFTTALRIRHVELVARSTGGSVTRAIKQLESLQAALGAEGLGTTRGAALAAYQLAIWRASVRDRAGASLAYQQVLATPLEALRDGNPLRQLARLQLATIEAAASRLNTARALLAATGLSADQCSAMPIQPERLSASVGEQDFPRDVLRWGFEGKVRLAFDLDAAGKPLDIRTVMASPPLVFSAATEKTAQGFRYRPAFRDGSGVACNDLQSGINYQIRQ